MIDFALFMTGYTTGRVVSETNYDGHRNWSLAATGIGIALGIAISFYFHR